MKKSVIIKIIFIAILLALISGFYMGIFNKIAGNVISEQNSGGTHQIGPSLEEQNCMRSCTSQGCNAGDMGCMKKNSEACLIKCNAQKPEATEETSCMEKCVISGCGEIDFACQTKNKEKCEKECNMIKEPEAKSEEERCIRSCVNQIEPGLICSAGEGGEKGSATCQKCAKECESLYAGPCLNEEKLEQKKKECVTCEHCYGQPIMGDSGEGYECIVSIECKDASSEFGDNPGTGKGIAAKTGEVIGNVFESIGNFFSGLFGREKTSENQVNSGQE